MLGGLPTFDEPLHVGRPNLGDRARLMTRVNDLLDRNWLTNDGPFVLEFEQAIVERLGVEHCVVMCNGTIALEIATRALGLHGEVIVPAFTFVATAHALQWQEITPVFCDVDPATHTIDPAKVEALITPRTTGILGVHLWGRPCDVAGVAEIADRRGIELLFDAAHAFGTSYRGRMIGNFGRAEVLSFHATKFLNSFEGGAVVTNDGALADQMRLMRNFGFVDYDTVDYIGTNGKMTEVCAAMGLTSLESFEAFRAVNLRNYETYRRALSAIPGIRLLEYDLAEQNNFQYIVLEIDEDEFGLSRDHLLAVLWTENVRARRYFYPGVHNMEPYRSRYPQAKESLAQTESLMQRVLTLPTGTAVEVADIEKVCSILREAAANSSTITKELAGTKPGYARGVT
jgi:dTDP-4-amino-4,6-dideoxygalactose transaminase